MVAKLSSVVLAFASLVFACGAPDLPATPITPRSGSGATVFEIRPVRYEGSVNGTMLVDVVGTSAVSREFSAEGLYFIPEGHPDDAPQRLGAAGPFTAGSEGEMRETIDVGPGEAVRVGIEVFCIDHSRPSPSTGTPFYVARHRMPVKLASAIRSGARRIIHDNHGDLDKSREAIQEYVWQMRAAGRLRLEGE